MKPEQKNPEKTQEGGTREGRGDDTERKEAAGEEINEGKDQETAGANKPEQATGGQRKDQKAEKKK